MPKRAGMDDDRYAAQRASLLAKTTELRKIEAKAVAYSELGYGESDIAAKLDASKSTVRGYAEKAMGRYGLSIMETLPADEEMPEYDPVEPGYHNELSLRRERLLWVECVERHVNSFPRDWANEVIEAAREDRRHPNRSPEGPRDAV